MGPMTLLTPYGDFKIEAVKGGYSVTKVYSRVPLEVFETQLAAVAYVAMFVHTSETTKRGK